MTAPQPERRIGRTIGALAAGLVVGLVLTLGTDAILHVTKVFPPYGQPASNGPLALATVYRFIYGAIGSYVAARLAPSRPMWHAMVLGILGLVVSVVGAVATWNREAEFGPHWYPVSLVVLALPAAWLGGRLYASGQRAWSATREYFAR
jgi:hypothetical protein